MSSKAIKTVITVTFNPAIDKSISVERLAAELKMNTTEPVYYAGGGGVNIVRALKKMDFPASAFYFEGGNSGKFFTSLLLAEKVIPVPIKISASTRENFIVNERRTGKQFRFGLPGPQVSASELDAMLNKLSAVKGMDYLVVSGSLAPGVSLDVFKTLKAIADSKNARLIVDTSGKGLEAAISSGVFMIKPSLKEMSNLVGKAHLTPLQAVKVARKLIESGKCEVIVLSLGGRGAILITKDITLEVNAPQVNVISTVGAGDSLLAGVLVSLANGKTLIDAFRYGIACGSAATLQSGTALCEKEVADELLKVIMNVVQ